MTTWLPARRAAATAAAVTLGAVLVGPAGQAAVVPGSAGPDVSVGLDNDNADNTFIQPPGVAAKQHLDNTDVVFGRDGADLLIGKLGADTLAGGRGPDILVGGPEAGSTQPNSDVLLGEEGDDVNVWAPGDGSEVFVGAEGYDTMVLAPFVRNPDGSLKLRSWQGRTIPRVDIGGKAPLRCQIVPVPAGQRLGEQFLVRFLAGDTLIVTVRQKDVERVLCASALPGHAGLADLTAAYPSFRDVPLAAIPGVLGAIVAQP
jgi:hypothetical protein